MIDAANFHLARLGYSEEEARVEATDEGDAAIRGSLVNEAVESPAAMLAIVRQMPQRYLLRELDRE